MDISKYNMYYVRVLTDPQPHSTAKKGCNSVNTSSPSRAKQNGIGNPFHLNTNATKHSSFRSLVNRLKR